MTDENDLAVSEGDDLPFAFSERPIRVILYGGQFVSIDDGETIGLSASGPDALATLAMRLFQAGFDPERHLILFRGGERVGRTSIGKAAGVDGHE
jgi:hypothetical protein